MKECVLVEMKSLSEYMSTKEEPLLKEVRRENTLPEEETNQEYQKRMHDNRNKGFTEKSLHGKFRKSTKAIADER